MEQGAFLRHKCCTLAPVIATSPSSTVLGHSTEHFPEATASFPVTAEPALHGHLFENLPMRSGLAPSTNMNRQNGVAKGDTPPTGDMQNLPPHNMPGRVAARVDNSGAVNKSSLMPSCYTPVWALPCPPLNTYTLRSQTDYAPALISDATVMRKDQEKWGNFEGGERDNVTAVDDRNTVQANALSFVGQRSEHECFSPSQSHNHHSGVRFSGPALRQDERHSKVSEIEFSPTEGETKRCGFNQNRVVGGFSFAECVNVVSLEQKVPKTSSSSVLVDRLWPSCLKENDDECMLRPLDNPENRTGGSANSADSGEGTTVSVESRQSRTCNGCSGGVNRLKRLSQRRAMSEANQQVPAWTRSIRRGRSSCHLPRSASSATSSCSVSSEASGASSMSTVRKAYAAIKSARSSSPSNGGTAATSFCSHAEMETPHRSMSSSPSPAVHGYKNPHEQKDAFYSYWLSGGRDRLSSKKTGSYPYSRSCETELSYRQDAVPIEYFLTPFQAELRRQQQISSERRTPSVCLALLKTLETASASASHLRPENECRATSHKWRPNAFYEAERSRERKSRVQGDTSACHLDCRTYGNERAYETGKVTGSSVNASCHPSRRLQSSASQPSPTSQGMAPQYCGTREKDTYPSSIGATLQREESAADSAERPMSISNVAVVGEPDQSCDRPTLSFIERGQSGLREVAVESREALESMKETCQRIRQEAPFLKDGEPENHVVAHEDSSTISRRPRARPDKRISKASAELLSRASRKRTIEGAYISEATAKGLGKADSCCTASNPRFLLEEHQSMGLKDGGEARGGGESAEQRTGRERREERRSEASRATETTRDIPPSEKQIDEEGDGDAVVASDKRQGVSAPDDAPVTVQRRADGYGLSRTGKDGETEGDETGVDGVIKGIDTASNGEICKEANTHLPRNETGQRATALTREEIVRASELNEGRNSTTVTGPYGGEGKGMEKRQESSERTQCYGRMLTTFRCNRGLAEGSLDSKSAHVDKTSDSLISKFSREHTREEIADVGCEDKSDKLATRMSHNPEAQRLAQVSQCPVPRQPALSSALCLKELSGPSGWPFSPLPLPSPLLSPFFSSTFRLSSKAVGSARGDGRKVDDPSSVFTEGMISEYSRASSSATTSTKASTSSAFRISSVRGASSDVACGARPRGLWDTPDDIVVKRKTKVHRTPDKGIGVGARRIGCVARSDTAPHVPRIPAQTHSTPERAGSCDICWGRDSEGKPEPETFMQEFRGTNGSETKSSAFNGTKTPVPTACIHIREASGRPSCGKTEQGIPLKGLAVSLELKGTGSRHCENVRPEVNARSCPVTNCRVNKTEKPLENTPHSNIHKCNVRGGCDSTPHGIAPIVHLKTLTTADPDLCVAEGRKTNVQGTRRDGEETQHGAVMCRRDPPKSFAECRCLGKLERHVTMESKGTGMSCEMTSSSPVHMQKRFSTDRVRALLSNQGSDASFQAVKEANLQQKGSCKMQRMQTEQTQRLPDHGVTFGVSRYSPHSYAKNETLPLHGVLDHTHRPTSTIKTEKVATSSEMSSDAIRPCPYGEPPTSTHRSETNPAVYNISHGIPPRGQTSKGTHGPETTILRDSYFLDRSGRRNGPHRFICNSNRGTIPWSSKTKAQQMRRKSFGLRLLRNVAETNRSEVNGESTVTSRQATLHREGKLFNNHGPPDECYSKPFGVRGKERRTTRDACLLNERLVETKHGAEVSFRGLHEYSSKRQFSSELVGVYVADQEDDYFEASVSPDDDAKLRTPQLVPVVAFAETPISSARACRQDNDGRDAAGLQHVSLHYDTDGEVHLPPFLPYTNVCPGVNANVKSNPSSAPVSSFCAAPAVRTSPSKSTKHPSSFHEQRYIPGTKTDHDGCSAEYAHASLASDIPDSTGMAGNSRFFTWLFPSRGVELVVQPSEAARDFSPGESSQIQEVKDSIFCGDGVVEQDRPNEKVRCPEGKDCTLVVSDSWEERIAATRRSVREQMGHLLQDDKIRWKVETCMAGVFDKLSARCRCCCAVTWQEMSEERKQRCGQITFWTLAGTLVALIFVAVICFVSAKVIKDTE
ncbi:putative transmembrane protein [Toxoplasma gondii MAS]|uniref:Putative transmembrane protein n=1 Tax=Toxoplasma gondii MAS TaxID=943118 RepID=A0A086QJP9_TOXGO|nr:putative transmembrane protein [Toxoplasma gondii MAS]